MRSNNLPVSFIVSSSILELGTGHRFSEKVLDGFYFFLNYQRCNTPVQGSQDGEDTDFD